MSKPEMICSLVLLSAHGSPKRHTRAVHLPVCLVPLPTHTPQLHMGKETCRKLADLSTAAAQASMELNLEPHLAIVEKVRADLTQPS